ncbi:MAG: glycosyltransferase [Parvularculaceae bacterium]
MTAFILSALALAAWTCLAFAHGGFWRARERLNTAPEPPHWPDVVAVIPARNEAASVERVIAGHMASDYPGAFSVVLVDDHSEDDTVARAEAAASGGARCFTIRRAPALEPNWTGKLWAVHNGLEHAKELVPDARYVLLTDADIVHAPDTLRRLVAKAEAEDLALASLMARLDARGLWGGLLIPAFVYFFQMLYPFPRANDSESRVAAAAGGCMLVRRNALVAIGGVEPIRDKLIDDCALAARLKNDPPPRRIWIGLAKGEAVSLRDNRGLGEIWNMVARTAFAQLNNSWLLLAGTVLGMTLVFLAGPVMALARPLHESAAASGLGFAAWALMALTYRPTAALYGQAAWKTVFLPAAAFLYTLMTVTSALRRMRGRSGRWKGRNY